MGRGAPSSISSVMPVRPLDKIVHIALSHSPSRSTWRHGGRMRVENSSTTCPPRTRRADTPAPDLEQMLATTPAETLRQAAAENYDDILYNQQL